MRLAVAMPILSCAGVPIAPPPPATPAITAPTAQPAEAAKEVPEPEPEFRYVARTADAVRRDEDDDRQSRVAAAQAAFRSGCATDRELRAQERVRLFALANARRDYETAHCKATLLTRTIPNDELRTDSSGYMVRGTDTVTQRLSTCDDPPDVAAAEAKRRADQSRLEHRDMGCHFEDQAAK